MRGEMAALTASFCNKMDWREVCATCVADSDEREESRLSVSETEGGTGDETRLGVGTAEKAKVPRPS